MAGQTKRLGNQLEREMTVYGIVSTLCLYLTAASVPVRRGDSRNNCAVFTGKLLVDGAEALRKRWLGP